MTIENPRIKPEGMMSSSPARHFHCPCQRFSWNHQNILSWQRFSSSWLRSRVRQAGFAKSMFKKNLLIKIACHTFSFSISFWISVRINCWWSRFWKVWSSEITTPCPPSQRSWSKRLKTLTHFEGYQEYQDKYVMPYFFWIWLVCYAAWLMISSS